MRITCDFTKPGTLPISPKAVWYRIHKATYAAAAFNATAAGNSRFSPIKDVAGEIVPTIYAGEDVKTALMETVLHDVPSPSHGYIYSPAPPEERVLSTIQLSAEIFLADLTVLGLRRIGLQSSDVIDGDKPSYPTTRTFAAELHAARTDVAGVIWDSRQTGKKAIVLFEDRLGTITLAHGPTARSVSIDDDSVRDELTELLDQLGANSLV